LSAVARRAKAEAIPINRVHGVDGFRKGLNPSYALIVEQRMAECLDIADRAYILQTGRLLMQGTASDIKGNPDVRKAYLGL
jgi:ABC-type branched-subunit amino acid transport system ATPase component